MNCPAPPSTFFAQMLVAWQHQHGRHDLPWQGTQEPYRIWVSEIMLQQTQVGTVIPFYQRFMTAFPDVVDLARADLETVLGHWAGLGYYARGRHLHRAAQEIVQQGFFPRSPEELQKLPGIGRSTAAAIAVFAFGRRAAILDGNVKRVLGRFFALDNPGDAELWALAESQLPDRHLEAYTQGLMDLGSLLCTRARPQCTTCPLQPQCQAYLRGETLRYPTPRRKAVRSQRHHRLLLLCTPERQWLMEKRPAPGVWGGLWSFPMEIMDSQPAGHSLTLDLAPYPELEPPPFIHRLTHFNWHLTPRAFKVRDTVPPSSPSPWHWGSLSELMTYPLPAPIRQLLHGLTRKL
ncbi:A/G-specific adenine glycosylase [Ferrovum myxofaciens]|uniref:Adenine DNA glycosylase n=2 Tax=root TaxID=1 RepID=A0A149W128_9PROT|nr:A/G-specific adenine glycosylase [Ferrovum myxofaciens]KXW59189.1 A/G-specific adenine glycosylase [Ferrovum myxofaciens]